MSTKKGLVELITEIGNDNLEFQPLDSCITDMKACKGHRKYTFGSEMGFDLDGTTKAGFVVWIDRDKLTEFMAK